MVEGDEFESSVRIIQGTPESGWTTFPWPEDVYQPSPESVRSIAIDDRGNRWFFCDCGFARQASDGRWTVFPSEADWALAEQDPTLGRVADLFYGSETSIAFGGDGSSYLRSNNSDAGFFRLNEAGNWRRYHTDDPPVGRDVAAIAADPTGRVWLASRNLNLLERRGDGTWMEPLPTTSQSSSLSAELMTDHRGRIWLADGAVLWHIDPATQDRRRYDKADGLDVGAILVLAPDPSGAVWAGGENGLSRQAAADGRWEAVPLPDPSMSRRVAAIDFDRQGGAWVGIVRELKSDPSDPGRAVTRPGGVLHRDRSGQWQVFSVADGLINDVIRDLLLDRQGNLWVGHGEWSTGEGGGATRFAADGTWTRFTDADGLIGAVKAIEEDRDGNIWFGTRRGVSRRSPSGVWASFAAEIGIRPGLNYQGVTALVAGPDGSVWIGTDSSLGESLWKHHPDSGFQAHKLSTRSGGGITVAALAVDRRGGILVGLPNQRIERIEADGTMSTLIINDRLNGSISDLAPDARGQLWAATADGLARQGSDGRWRTFHTGDGLPGPLVEAAVVDPAGGSVWVGVGPTQPSHNAPWLSGGLCQLVGDGPCQRVDVPELAAGNGIRTLALDGAGSLWLASYEAGRGSNQYSMNRVGTGVHRRDQAGQWAHYDVSDGLPSNEVRAIAVDASGDVWFATDKGLGHLVPARMQTGASWLNESMRSLIDSDDGGDWTTLTMADGLPSNEIHTVSIAPDGALWVGTADGVARRGGDGAWRSWGTSEGLSAPNVIDIAFDTAGNAWLATTGGGAAVLLRQW
jgi:ligand-binding sensor domain-containing protein